MEARLRIKFEDTSDNGVRCVVCVDDRAFIGKQPIQRQADRISPIKRAKQKAFVRAMSKVIGYLIDRIKEKS